MHVCDMTHAHVWQDSFTSVTWLYLHVWTDSCVCVWVYVCVFACVCAHHRVTWLYLHVSTDSSMLQCVAVCCSVWQVLHTWMSHVALCDMTLLTCVNWLIYMCELSSFCTNVLDIHTCTHMCIYKYATWHGSFMCAWLVHICDLIYKYATWHGSFTCAWLVHVCHMLTYVTKSWDVHICDLSTYEWAMSRCIRIICNVTYENKSCDMAHSYVLDYECVASGSYGNKSCDMAHSYVLDYECVASGSYVNKSCDMAHSYVLD